MEEGAEAGFDAGAFAAVVVFGDGSGLAAQLEAEEGFLQIGEAGGNDAVEIRESGIGRRGRGLCRRRSIRGRGGE